MGYQDRLRAQQWKEACERDFIKRLKKTIAEFRAGEFDEQDALNKILDDYDDCISEN